MGGCKGAALQSPSADGSNPAISGHRKPGHFRRPETGVEFHFAGPDTDKNLRASVDRIDSNGHYEHGNLQVVCQFVNFWKGDSDNEEFKRLLMLVRGEDCIPA